MHGKILFNNDILLEDIKQELSDSFHNNKSLLENELRKSFFEKIKEEFSESADVAIRHIKVVLEAAELGLCATSTPFLLLQDSLDVMSRQKCDEIFNFIERNLNMWKREPLNNAGKNYLLRMCNGLLKRLSPSQDTLLCGRIQIFLAQLFPISERSGLNLNGQFNLDNITLYESQEEFIQFKESRTNFLKNPEEKAILNEEQIKIDTKIESYEFYEKFWSVQDVFKDPTQCFDPDKWIKFVVNTNEIMDIFLLVQEQEQRLHSRSHAPASNENERALTSSPPNYYWSSPTKRTFRPYTTNQYVGQQHEQLLYLGKGKKRRRRTVSNEQGIVEDINSAATRMEEDQLIDESLNGLDNFFAKYLTGSNLLHMQIYDLQFRRCILLQYLFTFQYLTTESKFKATHQVLDENQKAWLGTTQQIIYDLLGPKMQESIKKFLAYEDFWNEWKNGGCPVFTKSPPPPPSANDEKSNLETISLSKKNKNGYAKKIHMDLGNPELTALWNYEPDNVKACASESRNFRPSLRQFLDSPQPTASPQTQPGAEDEVQKDAVTLEEDADSVKAERDITREWKTLRLLSRESKHFFWSYFSNASASSAPASNKNGTGSGGTKIITDFITVLGDKIKAEEHNASTISRSRTLKRTSIESQNVVSADKDTISSAPSREVSFTDVNNGAENKETSSNNIEDVKSTPTQDPEEQSVHESVNESSAGDKSFEEGEIENSEVVKTSETPKREKTLRSGKAKSLPKKATTLRSRSKRLKAKQSEPDEE